MRGVFVARRPCPQTTDPKGREQLAARLQPGAHVVCRKGRWKTIDPPAVFSAVRNS